MCRQLALSCHVATSLGFEFPVSFGLIRFIHFSIFPGYVALLIFITSVSCCLTVFLHPAVTAADIYSVHWSDSVWCVGVAFPLVPINLNQAEGGA